jgi:alpha-tubulin suppressor-like RCC1 family protein
MAQRAGDSGMIVEQLLFKDGSITAADALLYAWGQNTNGYELGIHIFDVNPDMSWTSISGGTDNSLAIRSDGLLFAWGTNNVGQLGDGTISTKSSPIQIGSDSWTAVAGGQSHAAAIRSDGLLFTWGNGILGALGDGTTVSKSSPVQIGSSSWTAVAVGV